MTPSNNSSEIPETPNHEQEEALREFAEQCPNPTPIQISEWQERYPKFVEEISDLAHGLQLLAHERGNEPLAIPTDQEIKEEVEKARQKFREIQNRTQMATRLK